MYYARTTRSTNLYIGRTLAHRELCPHFIHLWRRFSSYYPVAPAARTRRTVGAAPLEPDGRVVRHPRGGVAKSNPHLGPPWPMSRESGTQRYGGATIDAPVSMPRNWLTPLHARYAHGQLNSFSDLYCYSLAKLFVSNSLLLCTGKTEVYGLTPYAHTDSHGQNGSLRVDFMPTRTRTGKTEVYGLTLYAHTDSHGQNGSLRIDFYAHPDSNRTGKTGSLTD
ncbi:unnamed protein product [Trichogramma brassicae]|uniref:Uncharacterized protein n=1 Tax=Trichogramma brassicae TaxID=86971 RepID=A0A6H5IKC8_9HYME|nr:unnamed protein product [Trichogramma brassicae]